MLDWKLTISRVSTISLNVLLIQLAKPKYFIQKQKDIKPTNKWQGIQNLCQIEVKLKHNLQTFQNIPRLRDARCTACVSTSRQRLAKEEKKDWGDNAAKIKMAAATES